MWGKELNCLSLELSTNFLLPRGTNYKLWKIIPCIDKALGMTSLYLAYYLPTVARDNKEDTEFVRLQEMPWIDYAILKVVSTAKYKWL